MIRFPFSTIPFYSKAPQLVNLLTPNAPINNQYPIVKLNWRQRCDLELIVNGALTPLNGYMDSKNYYSVCQNSKLISGLMFPIPFVLEIPKTLDITSGFVNLHDDRDDTYLATVKLNDVWSPDKKYHINNIIFDMKSRQIQRIHSLDCLYAGGEIVNCHTGQEWNDFLEFRKSPLQIRDFLQRHKWERVVAFQTRNPMHYAHIELVKRAAQMHNCNILLQPVSGPTKSGDIDYITRMKAYEAVLHQFPQATTLLNLLPLAMRMGGPREALLHCIIRQNYGATHFIIGRDHAGPGSNSKGQDFYKPYEARDTVLKEAHNFEITPIPFDMVVYYNNSYHLQSEVPEGAKVKKLSGTEVRRRLRDGEEIPEWFSPPTVVNILRQKFEQDKWSDLNKALKEKDPKEIIKDAYERFGDEVAISFSGAEDVILLEYAKQLGLKMRVFSLDTGRLHPETYQFFENVQKHYNLNIEYCFPQDVNVQQLIRQKGMFSFYKDGHGECCHIRKVEPLKKQLSSLKAWITGMRQDQSVTRTDVPVVLIDTAFKGVGGQHLIKYNPLSSMKSSQVWEDIYTYQVPFNKLHSSGFVSIGCEPCTRAVLPNQHEREGRWWWEEPAHKECGLHKRK